MSQISLASLAGIRHRRTSMLADVAPQKYSVKFLNQSNNDWSFCCFQKDPTITVPNLMTLAWFVQLVPAGTSYTFTWQVTYDFVWAATGALIPGVVFDASQSQGADLDNDNYIQFTSLGANAYKLINESNGGTPGSLTIYQDSKIPDPTKTVAAPSIGIGMSGFGTFAMQAQPNVSTTFTPSPSYWCTFSESLKLGQVMTVTETTAAQKLTYSGALVNAVATLDTNNLMSVTYTN